MRWALVGWVNPIGPTLPPPPEEGYHQAVEVCKQAAGVGVDGKKIAHRGEGEKLVEKREHDGGARDDGQKVG